VTPITFIAAVPRYRAIAISHMAKGTTTMTNSNQELTLERLDETSGGLPHRPSHRPPSHAELLARQALRREINASMNSAAHALGSIHLF
jgi:hypothetical protein